MTTRQEMDPQSTLAKALRIADPNNDKVKFYNPDDGADTLAIYRSVLHGPTIHLLPARLMGRSIDTFSELLRFDA